MYRSLQPTEMASSEEETANNVELIKFNGRDSGLSGKVEYSWTGCPFQLAL